MTRKEKKLHLTAVTVAQPHPKTKNNKNLIKNDLK